MIDREAIEAALVLLNVRQRVHVKWVTRDAISGSHGRHRFGFNHVIALADDQDAAGTTRTLWHELMHCAQAEQFADYRDWRRMTKLLKNGVGYKANPFEVAALAFAAIMAETMLVGDAGPKLAAEILT